MVSGFDFPKKKTKPLIYGFHPFNRQFFQAQMSIHSMVSMGSCRVGPELRVTSADGQIIKQMQFDDDKVGK
jgi:hypothetical protein